MKLEELPAVYQASLDDATYEALFDDLSQLAACEVSVKHSAQGHVDEHARWNLTDARAALERGEVRAIQVRYVHDGAVWTDTILKGAAGLRLVRMATPVEVVAPS
jgi:hypothetical protein